MFSLTFLLVVMLNFNNLTTYPLPKDASFRRISWVKSNEIALEVRYMNKDFSNVWLFNTRNGEIRTPEIDILSPGPDDFFKKTMITDKPDLLILYHSTKLGLFDAEKNSLIKTFDLDKYDGGKVIILSREEFQIPYTENLIGIFARMMNGKDNDSYGAKYNALMVIDKISKTLDIIDIGDIKFTHSYGIDKCDKIVGSMGSTIYRYDEKSKKMLPVKTFPEKMEIDRVKSLNNKYYVAYRKNDEKYDTLSVYEPDTDKFTILENNLLDYYIGKNHISFLKISERETEIELYLTHDFSKKTLLKTYPYPKYTLTVMSPSEDKLAVFVMYDYVDIFDISDL